MLRLTLFVVAAFSTVHPTLRRSLARSSLPLVARPTCRSLLSPLSHLSRAPSAPRSSLQRASRRPPGRAKRAVLVVVALARHRSPPDLTSTTGIDWPRPSPPLRCKCMLQVFQMYVAIVTYGCCKSRSECYTCCIFCKCLQRYVASVCLKCFIYFRHMLQQLFIWMLHMFSHTCSKCFI
jgi:hypothetical protein